MRKIFAALAALASLAMTPTIAVASTTFAFSGDFDSTNFHWEGDGYAPYDYTGEHATLTAVSDSDPTLVSNGGVDSYVYDFSSITGSGNFDFVRFISPGSFRMLATPSLNQIAFAYDNGYVSAVMFALALPTAYIGGDYAAAPASLAGADYTVPFGEPNFFLLTGLADATFSATVSAPAPAPDAATWALFLIGFGAVGMTVRRRPLLAV